MRRQAVSSADPLRRTTGFWSPPSPLWFCILRLPRGQSLCQPVIRNRPAARPAGDRRNCPSHPARNFRAHQRLPRLGRDYSIGRQQSRLCRLLLLRIDSSIPGRVAAHVQRRWPARPSVHRRMSAGGRRGRLWAPGTENAPAGSAGGSYPPLFFRPWLVVTPKSFIP
jgi:hypothetical protein